MKTQQRNNIPDRSRPGSTTTAYPTVRLQGGGDKCATEAKTTIRLPNEGTTIGTWNVSSLHARGNPQELTLELKWYRWDILGLAVGQGLETLPWMRDTRFDTVEKTRNVSMG